MIVGENLWQPIIAIVMQQITQHIVHTCVYKSVFTSDYVDGHQTLASHNRPHHDSWQHAQVSDHAFNNNAYGKSLT